MSKILIHSNYSPHNFGGIEYVVKNIINAIADLNSHEIVCFFGSIDSGEAFDYDLKSKMIFRKSYLKVSGASILSFGNYFFLRHGINSDLVIYQEPYPTLWPSIFILNRILRKKLIVIIHADPNSHSFINFFYAKFRSIVFKNSNFVFTSNTLLEDIGGSLNGLQYTIPLAIGDIKTDFLSNLPKNYALFFGRLAQYKGIDILLDACLLVPNIPVVIAGDGPLASSILNFINSRNLENITFINKNISEDDKVTLINNCAFLIFPSINKNEAFGIIQLEAMRSGKAIINTSLNTGVNFVAPHGVCALTINPNSSAELSNAINLLWNNEELSSRLGKEGRKRFINYFELSNFKIVWKNLVLKVME